MSDRNPSKQYIPLESNETQVIGSITNQLLFELLSELKLISRIMLRDDYINNGPLEDEEAINPDS